MRKVVLVAALASVVQPSADARQQPASAIYTFVKAIPVGGEGGWDYLSVDPAAHRLYVSHATHIVVIDTERNEVVGDIADTPGVHGFAIAADLGRGFATNGREGTVSIVDLKTLKTIQKVTAGENPDAVTYDPKRQEVYAFNGRGRSATVINASTGAVAATIPLDGKPEFGVVDASAGKVYVNLEDKSAIAVIDAVTHRVTATWPLAPGEEPTGLAIDIEHHRLFAGCGNRLMVMVDTVDGKVLGSVPIGTGVDATAFDAGTRLAFASTGGGTVTVAREDTSTKLNVVQTLETARSARTMTLDPATHRIYLSAADRDKPGSFRVLVYELTVKK